MGPRPMVTTAGKLATAMGPTGTGASLQPLCPEPPPQGARGAGELSRMQGRGRRKHEQLQVGPLVPTHLHAGEASAKALGQGLTSASGRGLSAGGPVG